ncbi:MAG TPA: hypothetical protein VFW25_12145 [Silvibacterium sp.]|nr:hypothetical protein [Silvibacterium sp.]
MNRKSCSIFMGLCALALCGLCTLPVSAQNSEAKEKPPLYSYVANWQIPRAHWADMAKEVDMDKSILDKAVADGTIVGYGSDENLVHTPDGYTHDDWWSSMSMAGLLKVLDQFYAAGNVSTPALDTATKHGDELVVSRYYNWHSGSVKNAPLQVAFYQLKAHAPDDAVDMLSKNLVVPLMEKLIADGTVVEYEIDTQAVHTDAPGTFSIVWISANNDAVDKVNAALKEAMAANPLGGPAFLSMIDFSKHHDELWRDTSVYK